VPLPRLPEYSRLSGAAEIHCSINQSFRGRSLAIHGHKDQKWIEQILCARSQ
jgi:hypothetical protein